MGARVAPRAKAAALAAVAVLATAAGCTASETGGDQVATPEPRAPWQLVLDGSAPADPGAAVYDLDGEVGQEALAALRDANPDLYLVCYFSLGTWEEWRPDAAAFPPDVIGEPLPDWPGERYVDVRRRDALGPVWEARVQACADAGFDAVDPDNIDVFANNSGFDLTAADAEAAFKLVAGFAHERGLAVGQKNAAELVPALAGVADFAVVEECIEREECGPYAAYVDAGKPVFAVEYPNGDDVPAAIPAGWCERAVASGISLLVSPRALDSPGLRCG